MRPSIKLRCVRQSHCIVLRLLAVSFLFAVFIVNSASALELTLQQAIDLSLASNSRIKLSELQVDGSALNVVQEESEFRTAFSPVAFVERDDDERRYALGISASRLLKTGTLVSVNVLDRHSDSTTENDALLRVALVQPLFRRFGRQITREAVLDAQSAHQGAQQQLFLTKIDTIVAVVVSFETVSREIKFLRAEQQSIQRSLSFLARVEGREKVGRASRADVLRIKLQLGQARLRLEHRQQSLAVSMSSLRELTGLTRDVDLVLTPGEVESVPTPALGHAVRQALSQRIEMALLRIKSADAHRALAIAERSLLPDLELTARFDQSLSTRAGNAQSDRDEIFVGIRSRSGFTRYREKNALIQARNAIDIVSAERRLLTEQITREVEQSRVAWIQAATEHELATKNEQFAAQRLTATEKLFAAGRGSSVDVADAEDAFVQSQVATIVAKSARLVGGYRFSRAIGDLLSAPASSSSPPADVE